MLIQKWCSTNYLIFVNDLFINKVSIFFIKTRKCEHKSYVHDGINIFTISRISCSNSSLFNASRWRTAWENLRWLSRYCEIASIDIMNAKYVMWNNRPLADYWCIYMHRTLTADIIIHGGLVGLKEMTTDFLVKSAWRPCDQPLDHFCEMNQLPVWIFQQ